MDIQFFIGNGYLGPGDVLVIDNAAVHWANDNWQQLQQLYNAHNIRLVFLPTYSPELQVAEHVISYLKTHFRYHSDPNLSFVQNIVNGCFGISTQMMYNFYEKCILANESF